MRVAVDATPLTLTTGGLVRYTGELSSALAENYPRDDFVLLSDQPFRMPEPRKPNLLDAATARNALERRWWTFGVQRVIRRLHCDVFHGTNFEVPYVPLCPSVVTVHDLSPWMNPEWHFAAGRVRRRTPLLVGLCIANMVITPTEAVRAQVIERFGVTPAVVVAVPHGASRAFRPVKANDQAPYFLYAGALEPRKNLNGLIEAWREVRRKHPVDLVIAGKRRAGFPELPREPGLIMAGEVSDGDLAGLYSGAIAAVNPSHYEGFGLPVLEAMQCGACVFISKDAALREVAGDAGVSLEGEKAWVEAMCAAVTQREWLQERRESSLARARAFSWERSARLTHHVYQEAVRRFSI
jgi:glycosyltransferase involved in cell wall biosynthesis